MEYDLVRMGSTEFEDMAVALCNANFGPGGQTFGAGKDGGREWTYHGELPLPIIEVADTDWDDAQGSHWTGYTVVQAKHKSRLEGGAEDVNWLLTTMQKEVNAWLSEDKDRKPKPRNLLFITNVRLSAVQEKGGIDRVTAAMKSHAKKLGLRGWAIWHAAHISRLLDNHPGVRQTYLGLVLTGDLLSAMLEIHTSERAEPIKTLTSFVVKELLAQSTVRLTKAGDGPNKELLYDIGIDLPSRELDAGTGATDDSDPVFFARNMIDFGDSPRHISNSRFSTVLVGGPGQGKSTVGLLLCQAYRAAILAEQAESLPYEHKTVLRQTIDHLAKIGISLPKLRRWPVYIRLSEYSERIMGNEDYSLLGYITDEINRRSPATNVQKNHVYAWLKKFPWMLVLDGLDEVADTVTRETLFSKISEFILDASEQNSDISILATTRRQGYENDLRTLEPREFELVELNTDQALGYALQLVSSRHPSDSTFAHDIHTRLKEASRDEMTAKLMGTPLQVSIMASLLEDRIRLPRTRHALFADFYSTIFMRESNKLGNVGKQVNQHRSSIDALHDAAGILLHTDAEKSGQADAHLKRSELQTLAKNHLHETMTYDLPDAERTSKELIKLATDRFILLVEPSAGEWGFELRSFQEYMASRFLVSGDPQEVLTRLEVLAKSAHWRNTWLFAAGQVFDNYSHLRSKLIDLVLDLDEASIQQSWVKSGSDLAADLLEDNFASETPGFRRKLILRVSEYVDNPSFPYKLIPILHEASLKDKVVYQKIRGTFENALLAGGPRHHYASKILTFWSRHHQGGISAYARTRVTLTPSRSADDAPPSYSSSHNEVSPRRSPRLNFSKEATNRFTNIVSPHLRLDGLSESEVNVLSRALDETSARFIKLDNGSLGYTFVKFWTRNYVNPLAPILASERLFEVVLEACLKLPEGEEIAYGWFLSQVSQGIGQEFVDDRLREVVTLPSRS
ncbi:hypothetical protein H9638_16240 [Arthrobacter sp. Sa2BUA2]|uniref:NACHT domain-containing protein n=1 Tax=Arthrobacter pullicola TaxID=2762224 RepID=A0ABR8YM78_9MICC|nr:hypothetical protein [Arthrobacter pullicola]MBD8045358.1 hypothetical protein [Arthrobacter pullicola]